MSERNLAGLLYIGTAFFRLFCSLPLFAQQIHASDPSSLIMILSSMSSLASIAF